MTRIGIDDFARKVLIMRQAQADFDKSGYWSDQSSARNQEAIVDDLIAKILDKQQSLDL